MLMNKIHCSEKIMVELKDRPYILAPSCRSADRRTTQSWDR